MLFYYTIERKQKPKTIKEEAMQDSKREKAVCKKGLITDKLTFVAGQTYDVVTINHGTGINVFVGEHGSYMPSLPIEQVKDCFIPEPNSIIHLLPTTTPADHQREPLLD
jgi:hypothetical protein